jgi:hypothetical protein
MLSPESNREEKNMDQNIETNLIGRWVTVSPDNFPYEKSHDYLWVKSLEGKIFAVHAVYATDKNTWYLFVSDANGNFHNIPPAYCTLIK